MQLRIRKLIHQTHLAVLLQFNRNDHQTIDVWFPKSKVRYSDEKVVISHDFWDVKAAELHDQGIDLNEFCYYNEIGKHRIDKPKKRTGNGMNNKQLVHLIQTGFTTVVVKLSEQHQCYTYKSNIEGLKDGDLVVVPVKGNTTFKTAVVQEVHSEPQIDLDSDVNYRWIASKVDLDSFYATVEQEDKLRKSLKDCEFRQRRETLLATLGLNTGNTALLALTQMERNQTPPQTED